MEEWRHSSTLASALDGGEWSTARSLLDTEIRKIIEKMDKIQKYIKHIHALNLEICPLMRHDAVQLVHITDCSSLKKTY
jgi:hypothetical protein